jgi:hypothetical protein
MSQMGQERAVLTLCQPHRSTSSGPARHVLNVPRATLCIAEKQRALFRWSDVDHKPADWGLLPQP